VIYACVNIHNGNARIVRATETCRNPEIKVHWNVAGAQGATGPIGPQGATGVQGPTGAQGPQGETGPQGAIGPAGVQGAQGTPGAPGAPGATGAEGATGAQGDVGPTGAPGATGPEGPQGATGPQGPKGDRGLTWRGNWSPQTTYLIDDAVARDGSSYVAKVANLNDQPPSTSWELLAAKGAAGLPGAAGTNGTNGTDGMNGLNGTNGLPGTTGQDAKTATQFSQLALSSVGGLVDVGGLTLTMNVPATTATLFLTTDGGVFVSHAAPANGQGVVVQVVMILDGDTSNPIAFRQINAVTQTFVGTVNWSFSTTVSNLSAGNHTVNIMAALVSATASTSAVVGSSSPTSTIRGRMTGIIINK
jgi:hypothetical protein